MALGLPLSPSSAWTLATMSPGSKVFSSFVMGGADVKIGGMSWTSFTTTTIGSSAMFLESSPGSAYASYRNIHVLNFCQAKSNE